MDKKDKLTNRERFHRIMNFEDVDRMPMYEWAPFWNLTLERWIEEGLDIKDQQISEIGQSLGLDLLSSIWIPVKTQDFPTPKHFGEKVISSSSDYDSLKNTLFPENATEIAKGHFDYYKDRHESGEAVSWITFEGFFWFPRTLFGIEDHFYAFHDEPELMHRMNSDLADFMLKHIEEICKIHKPDFMTFAEDMSYNHGPMLSKELFDEFMLPYYKKVIPALKENNIKVLIDSDGDVTDMIPWLIEAGIEGLLPLERQAGVDVLSLKKKYPEFLFLGAFDKLVMKNGEEAMRKEFERLLPAIKMGGFIASVDHQTPPDVSLENYKTYVKLLREYAKKIN